MRRAVAARFTTVVYGLLNLDGRLTYCNAGHNPPLLICREGVQRLATGGPVVGAFDNVRYEEATLQLYPNDVLVVFSDGITEALDPAGIEFGDERLLASVETNRALPPQSLLEHLLDDVRQFSANDMRYDDQTALILRYSGA